MGVNVFVQYISVNIRFLLTIFVEYAGSGFLQLTNQHHTPLMHCSLHIEFLLVKMKMLSSEFFFQIVFTVRFITIHYIHLYVTEIKLSWVQIC